MTYQGPIDSRWRDIEREDEAAAALARFRAKWPPERCKRLGDAMGGTPAEKAAANASYVADALARVRAETPADRAVVGLLSDAELVSHSMGQRKFNRENRNG